MFSGSTFLFQDSRRLYEATAPNHPQKAIDDFEDNLVDLVVQATAQIGEMVPGIGWLLGSHEEMHPDFETHIKRHQKST